MVRSKFTHISKKNKESTGFFQKIKNFFTGSELRLRIFTALLMFAFAFGIFSIGFFAVYPVAIILAVLMIYEYDRMFIAPLPSDPNIKGRVPSKESLSYFHQKFTFDVIGIVGILCFSCFYTVYHLVSVHYMFLFSCVFFVSVLISCANKRKHWFLESLPPFYIGLGIFGLLDVYLRSSWVPLLLLFVLTTATDSGAFFTGKMIGGPKLCPRISPKKTWSGFLGGIVFAITIVPLFFMLLVGETNSFIFNQIHLIAIASILAQIGDLFESYLKRTAGVKDSSQLIPGHGGFLDRFDSAIFLIDILLIVFFTSKFV